MGGDFCQDQFSQLRWQTAALPDEQFADTLGVEALFVQLKVRNSDGAQRLDARLLYLVSKTVTPSQLSPGGLVR